MRRPPVVLGMAVVTILALLLAVGLILFSVNPTQKSTQKELKSAVMSQQAIICAQVQNTANAYRFRSLTPSGEVEPIRHFLTRMEAQAETLRLARGSECRSAPNFPPVGIQVHRALGQIKRILEHFKAKLQRPIAMHYPSLDKQSGFPPAVLTPSNAGTDEDGPPAVLAPRLAPRRPVQAQRDPQIKERGALRIVSVAPAASLPSKEGP